MKTAILELLPQYNSSVIKKDGKYMYSIREPSLKLPAKIVKGSIKTILIVDKIIPPLSQEGILFHDMFY